MILRRAMMAGASSGEADVWEAAIIGLGGTITPTERGYADDLIAAIQAASYGAKIVYLLPFIGASIAAHRVPLRDSLGAGPATNGGTSPFTDADCDTATGIVNSTEKDAWLSTGILPQSVNSNNIGLGWYERNIGFGSSVEPIGCYDSTAGGSGRCVIDLRSNVQRFSHGNVSNSAATATTASSAHYYGQRSASTLRRLYKDGATVVSNTTADTGFVGGQSCTITVMGNQTHTGARTPWKGRGGCAYITDGTMSDADVADFHTLLGTYLITPTGR